MRDLLLLSGGIESSAIASWLRPELCLTIDYGQKAAEAEIHAARQICSELGLKHDALHVPAACLGSGDMASSPQSQFSLHSEFWPFRNQYLITLGAMLAVNRGFHNVVIGTVCTDTRHMDGSPAFVEAMNGLLVMQEGGIRLSAPALNMQTTELIRRSGIEDRVLAWTHSCHTGNLACGQCRGCYKHSEIMSSIGWPR